MMIRMSILKDDAIVLGRIDYSETSQVLVLLTRTCGKVRAIAKGVKRGTKTRFAAAVDLLELGELAWSPGRSGGHSGLATLTEWKQRRGFLGLREALPRMYAAQYAAEVTGALTEDADPHEKLFESLVDLLDDLSAGGETTARLVVYQVRLLEQVGSLPRFDVCVRCGRPEDLQFFSSFEGGTVCRHCEPVQVEKREIAADLLAALRSHSDNMAADLPEASCATRCFSLLDYHIAHLMGRQPHLSDRIVPAVERRRVR